MYILNPHLGRLRHMKSIHAIEDQLLSLACRLHPDPASTVRHPALASQPEWRGARVVITADFTYEPVRLGGEWVVRTQHATALSGLFFHLRYAFAPFLDATNKYGFYEGLAKAAQAHLAAHQPESDDPRPLLRAVLAAAFPPLAELHRCGTLPADAVISLWMQDAEGRQLRVCFPAGSDSSAPEA